MKKFVILILLVYSKIIYSQTNDSLIKNCLKEVLVAQSLLAENRNEDLVLFLAKNNWVPVTNTNKEIIYSKSIDTISNTGLISVFQRIKILSQNQQEGFYNKYIVLDFLNEKNEDMCFTKFECNNLLNKVKRTYELGMAYEYFQSLANSKQENMIITKIDRYNFSVENIKSPEKEKVIYKCSNFMGAEMFGLPENYHLFKGPGKNSGIILSYKYDFPCPEDKDNYRPSIVFLTVIGNSADQNKQNFDIDFFMGLNNFNDRIWDDN